MLCAGRGWEEGRGLGDALGGAVALISSLAPWAALGKGQEKGREGQGARKVPSFREREACGGGGQDQQEHALCASLCLGLQKQG